MKLLIKKKRVHSDNKTALQLLEMKKYLGWDRIFVSKKKRFHITLLKDLSTYSVKCIIYMMQSLNEEKEF